MSSRPLNIWWSYGDIPAGAAVEIPIVTAAPGHHQAAERWRISTTGVAGTLSVKLGGVVYATLTLAANTGQEVDLPPGSQLTFLAAGVVPANSHYVVARLPWGDEEVR